MAYASDTATGHSQERTPVPPSQSPSLSHDGFVALRDEEDEDEEFDEDEVEQDELEEDEIEEDELEQDDIQEDEVEDDQIADTEMEEDQPQAAEPPAPVRRERRTRNKGKGKARADSSDQDLLTTRAQADRDTRQEARRTLRTDHVYRGQERVRLISADIMAWPGERMV